MGGRSGPIEPPAEFGVDLCDLVGYARGEFREGRSEQEVAKALSSMTTSGELRAMKGVLRELYLETIGVSPKERRLVCLLQIASVAVATLIAAPLGPGWPMLVVAALIFTALYVGLDRGFEGAWRRRYLRRQHLAN